MYLQTNHGRNAQGGSLTQLVTIPQEEGGKNVERDRMHEEHACKTKQAVGKTLRMIRKMYF